MKWIFFITVTVLSLCACSPASNETPEIVPAETQTPIAGQTSISQSHAAILEIIESGNQAKLANDAKGMSEAAHLLTQLGAQPLNNDTPDFAEDWRYTANKLRGTDADPAYRGRVRGSAYREKILAPGAMENLEEIYYASEKAELTLKTLSGGALALQVAEQSDETPQAVCALDAQDTAASCQWLPLWTAKYNITITNHGTEPVSYLLVTN